jgi:Spy/CpxP family protein refolding chaperone
MTKRGLISLAVLLSVLGVSPLGSAQQQQRNKAANQAQKQQTRQRDQQPPPARQELPPLLQEPRPQGPPGGQPGEPLPAQLAFNRMAVMRLLNLTPEQLLRVREVRRRLAPQLEKLRLELQDRRDALRQATYGETLDQNLVEQRIREFLQTQAELIKMETRIEVAFRQLLTPEQLAKFREIQNEELDIRRMRRELREREQKLQEKIRPQGRPPEGEIRNVP